MANINGGGSNTNGGGLKFEDDVQDFIINQIKSKGYSIEEDGQNGIFRIMDKKHNLKAIFGPKSSIFKWLNISANFKRLSEKFLPTKTLQRVWSKNLIPDFVLLLLDPNPKFHVLEVKYQSDSGSVDEKLQTGKFKHEMWKKLFRQIVPETEITYSYFLSNWFMKEPAKGKQDFYNYHYQAVFDFLAENKINFYLNHSYDMQPALDARGIPRLRKNGTPVIGFKSVTPQFKDIKENPFNIEDFLK